MGRQIKAKLQLDNRFENIVISSTKVGLIKQVKWNDLQTIDLFCDEEDVSLTLDLIRVKKVEAVYPVEN